MNPPETTPNEVSPKELLAAERAIAARHTDRFPWGSLIWATLNLGAWLALWPAVFLLGLPLWVAFPVACVTVALSYLPSHEAQHSIFARPGARLRWLNEAVGTLSVLPLVIPYRVLRATHMEHHKHTNDPARDPDFSTHVESPLKAALMAARVRAPRGGQADDYRACLERLGREDLILETVIYELVFYSTLFALAWNGFALEAAALWWAPRHVGLAYILFYLSWAPHNPGLARGRYRDTRSFRSWGGNLSSLGMQAHIVHHLYPRIPLLRTPRAYREMRPLLEARGCRLDDHGETLP
jgi:beta-carotene hydroxylase